jgi:2'-5' RNA ligase superfamily protein
VEPRIAVVVFPPARSVAAAEEFRRLHDPLFHRIPAHVAVVPAISWRTRGEALPRLHEAVRGTVRGAFPVNLCGAGRTRDGTVFVKVDEGTAALGELHGRLLVALGPPPGHDPPPFVPVLGIGRAPTVSEAEFLQRQAAGHLAPVRFSVEHLSFIVEDARGLWHEEERLDLVA